MGATGNRRKKSIWALSAAILLAAAAACAAVAGCGAAGKIRAERELEGLAERAGGTDGDPTEALAPPAGEAPPGAAGAPESPGPDGTEAEAPPWAADAALLEGMGVPVPDREIDFAALREEANPDIYAWICIPGTRIDYPVLQHPTDNSHYLSHNLDGSEGYPGCIYTESYNAKDFSDFNTALYGHNMKDGSMFAGLHRFEDAAFFEGHPYIYVYTPERLLAYEVWAAYEFSDAHLLLAYDTETERGIERYLEDAASVRSMGRNVREGLSPGAGSHIITLSTCVGGKPNSRYLVQGVLLNEG